MNLIANYELAKVFRFRIKISLENESVAVIGKVLMLILILDTFCDDPVRYGSTETRNSVYYFQCL